MIRAAAALALLALPLSAQPAGEALAGLRTGALELLLLDADGAPAAGRRLRIRQLRHDFLFGSNLFFLGASGDPALDRRYAQEFEALFDCATLPFYWKDHEPRPGDSRHGKVMELARWCRERGIRTKGHPLVWNHAAGTPAWLPGDPHKVLALSSARVGACVEAFAGWIDMWDVVNEAAEPFRIADNPMTAMLKALGRERCLADSFRAARAAGPGAVLLINDYKTDESLREVLGMLDRVPGLRFDAIGIQSHMRDRAWTAAEIRGACERIAAWPEARGVPLHFTEISFPSGPRIGGADAWGPSDEAGEAFQAEAVELIYRTLFAQPQVVAATWWDFCDLGAWEGVPIGLLRRDMSRKPACELLRRLIRGEWWTDLELLTGPDGRAAARVFFGRHELVLPGPDGAERTIRFDYPRPWPPQAAMNAVKRFKAAVAPL